MTDNEARPPRPDWTVLSRVSSDFASLSRQMAQMSTDLTDLRTTMTAVRPEPAPTPPSPEPAPPRPAPPTPPAPPQAAWQPPPVAYPPVLHPPRLAPPFVPPRGTAPPQWAGQPSPPPPPRPSLLRRAASATDGRLVGTILAVAGVGVTLVGVVLLLVLAAQAGILRPEVRVGAGGLLAAALVAIGARDRRRGSRVGPIALVATGIGTAYLDIVATTRIYHWLPAAAGLVLAGVVALGGLSLARRWGSEHLALLVVVPLIGAAPFVAGGIGLPLIGFMLVLAAITLPFGVGTDAAVPWANLQYARVAAAALWLVPTIVTMAQNRSEASALDQWALAVACLVAAAIALGGGLLTRGDTAHAVVAALGAVPVLVCGTAVDRPLAAGATAVMAVVLTAAVTLGRSHLTEPLRITGGVLAAVAALIAVPTAFGGPVAVPVLIGLAVMVTVVGRDDALGRGIGLTLTGVGALGYLSTTRLESLVDPTVTDTATATSSIVGGLLLAAAAMTTAGVVASRLAEAVWPWILGGVVALYGITATAVTAGVAIGGTGTGFLAGHMAATIVWVCAAGAALVLAGRVPAGPARIAPIAGALTLAAAAVAKLIVFDLATLDGGFRVGAFIAVGLVLLALGARYARTGQES
ncbi:DUF2339 domain-containing protein [Williamsia herbipolensis]|uniref:DUF2339 domain-containing protein n=1 Tax=Williamsia herbipolensis TaxID=1603258 RepID=A0AAU4JWT4_9NOCA|nr:DUF2339 domain-containing protein [Williamsia herbipolensis]